MVLELESGEQKHDPNTESKIGNPSIYAGFHERMFSKIMSYH